MNDSFDDNKPLMPEQCGGSQFRIWANWLDWENSGDHGRHSADQGKHGRKSRLNRTLRALRAEVQSRDQFDTWIPYDRKINLHVDYGYWSRFDLTHGEEADIIIDTDFIWTTDYIRLTFMQLSKTLLTSWLYDYGEYDYETDDRLSDDFYRFDDDIDPNDQAAYYAGDFYRKPVWNYTWGECRHQDPVYHHGWQGYEEELLVDAIAGLHLGDMDLRDEMNDDYGRGLEDDLEQQRQKQDDRDYQAMVDAWDSIDQVRFEAELDAADDTASLSQHGGARGWKALKVAGIALAEFA